MRKGIASVGLGIGLAVGLTPTLAAIDITSDPCGFHTPYNVKIDPAGLAFSRADGSPKTVFMRDGQSRVDEQVLDISAADRRRLRQ